MRGAILYGPRDALPLDQVAEGYRAMDERRAIKTLLRHPPESVTRFSAEPMNKATLRASSARSSYARPNKREASLLGFFKVTVPPTRITAGRWE
jgi:hypothetical protein